jgi:hypothetical protein
MPGSSCYSSQIFVFFDLFCLYICTIPIVCLFPQPTQPPNQILNKIKLVQKAFAFIFIYSITSFDHISLETVVCLCHLREHAEIGKTE